METTIPAIGTKNAARKDFLLGGPGHGVRQDRKVVSERGVTPPFVKNCTLSREAELTTAPELLQRGPRGSVDRIEDLSSVSPVDPDINQFLS